MHLGNNGWGMREMIIYLCILGIILLFVAISIHSLYRKIDKDSKNQEDTIHVVAPDAKDPVVTKEPTVEVPPVESKPIDYDYYRNQEARLVSATNKYLVENPTEIGPGILTISEDSLVNLGFMTPLYSQFGNKCTGYSNVYVQEGSKDYTVKSYIKCENYTSEGY